MQDNSNPDRFIKKLQGCPARAQERDHDDSIGYGVLKSSATREAKGLPGTGLQPLLYCLYMMYMVTYHCIRHLP